MQDSGNVVVVTLRVSSPRLITFSGYGLATILGELQVPTEAVRHLHLVRRPALRAKQVGTAHQDAESLRPVARDRWRSRSEDGPRGGLRL